MQNLGFNISVSFVESDKHKVYSQSEKSDQPGIRQVHCFPCCHGKHASSNDSGCRTPLRVIVTLVSMEHSVADFDGFSSFDKIIVLGGFRLERRPTLLESSPTGESIAKIFCRHDCPNDINRSIYWGRCLGFLPPQLTKDQAITYSVQRAVYEFNGDGIPWQYIWTDGNHGDPNFCFEVSVLSSGRAIKINSALDFANQHRFERFNLIGIFDSPHFDLKAATARSYKRSSSQKTALFGPNIIEKDKGQNQSNADNGDSGTSGSSPSEGTVIGLCDPLFLQDDDVPSISISMSDESLQKVCIADLQEITSEQSVVVYLTEKLKKNSHLRTCPSSSILDYLLPGFLLFSSTSCADNTTEFDTCDRLRLLKASVLKNQPQLAGYMPPPYTHPSLQLFPFSKPVISNHQTVGKRMKMPVWQKNQSHNSSNQQVQRAPLQVQEFLAGKFTFPVLLEQCMGQLLMQIAGKGDLTLPLSQDVHTSQLKMD